jgi:hypothetical protein
LNNIYLALLQQAYTLVGNIDISVVAQHNLIQTLISAPNTCTATKLKNNEPLTIIQHALDYTKIRGAVQLASKGSYAIVK